MIISISIFSIETTKTYLMENTVKVSCLIAHRVVDMKLYQNGEVVVQSDAQWTIDTNDVPVAIGRNSEGNREHYQGSIDDVSVWHVALDDDEIQSTMDQIAPVEPNEKLTTTWGTIKTSF